MDEENIVIEKGNTRFNYRVGIILEHDGKVLLENFKDFWNMIGGRVHFLDSSLESAKRELKEELDLEVDNLKLINVSENFFSWLGKEQQELLFVYKAHLDDSYECVHEESFKCLDADKKFQWHDKKDIAHLNCKPEIIKELIYLDDENISHIINKNS